MIIDAGTGIRRASELFEGGPFRGTILLGHFHWDHTQGLPFFSAGDKPGSEVTLYAPGQPGPADIKDVLARFMSPPHFPIGPSQLRGSWHFAALEPGEHRIEGFSVLALEIPHKGGRTFGYRISDGGATMAYLSDHWPLQLGPGPDGVGEYHEAALRLAEGVDVMFHDAQYADEELAARAYFGHSSPGYAFQLARRAGSRRLMLFHHDPARTDTEIDALVGAYQDRGLPVEAACEEAVLDIHAVISTGGEQEPFR